MFVAYGVHWSKMYNRLSEFKESVGAIPEPVQKAFNACEYMTSLGRGYSVSGDIISKPPLQDFIEGIVYLRAQYSSYPNQQYLHVLAVTETEFRKYDVYSKLPLLIEPKE